MKRLLTALLLIPLVSTIVFWAPVPVLVAVVAAVAGLCFREYNRLVAAHQIAPPGLFGYVAGFLFLLTPTQELSVLLAATVLALALTLRSRDLAQCLPSVGALLLGLLAIFGAWRCAILLRAASPHWLFFALAVNWIGDSAALFVGRTVGRHKLAPRVSPAKSWEGAIASALAGVLFGVLYLEYFLRPGIGIAFLVGGLASIAGQVGDLAESAWKRGGKVKDSGTGVPGHGGWLDRLDSSLFSLITTWLLVELLRLG